MFSYYNQKGCSKKCSQYVLILYNVVRSDVWCFFVGVVIKVYIELCVCYNGYNNGDLSLFYCEVLDLLEIGKFLVV